MLEVFLEEAVEVLAAVDATLPRSRQDPTNAEHLTSLRRAFHTLKGSGRMVGLTDLGEAAWQIEQVFNKLVQDELPGTPDLYRLVALAHKSFASWIGKLSLGEEVAVDAETLTEWARRVRVGEALPPPEGPPAHDETSELNTATATMPAVKIGAISISPVLYGIFIEEARQHVLALQDFGRRVVKADGVAADPEFLRAAHTLCGISATVGFDAMSELASSLECTLLRVGKGDVLDPAGRAHIARAAEHLSHMVAHIADGRMPDAERALVEALNKTATSRPFHPVSDAAGMVVRATTHAVVADQRPLSGDRRTTRLDDDIDHDLLAVFVAEAQELLPRIGQDLRDWRSRPQDKLLPQSLQRLLHTLKGTSRMAGAMALGELTHRMETRIENASRLGVVPETLYDELDASYDRLNELFDRLQGLDDEPVTDSHKLAILTASQPLAPVTLTGDLRPGPMTERQPTNRSMQSQPTLGAVTATGPLTVTTDTKLAAAVQNAGQTASGGGAQRAVLRVRAESAERLANQAGEVAIARARAETELRGIRGAMRDLTDNIIRLRAQLREVEMQAEIQMQSRIAESEETHERFDPLEFDRFTRLQELTRLMAESVNDVATVQQNLMRNLEEGEAALGAQARTTRELQDDLVRIRMDLSPRSVTACIEWRDSPRRT